MAKYDELLVFVEHIQPLCVLIAESWLKSTIPDSLCCLGGYRIYRADHPDDRGYDGVCIMIRSKFCDRFQITDFSLDTPGTDNLFLTLKSPALTMTIGCIYRPRACASDNALLEGLSRLSTECSNLVVAGDFNVPELNWPLRTIPNGTGMPALFAQMLSDSNLSQLIEEPTRFRQGQNSSTLDLLLTNDTDLVTSIDFHPPLGKSDHSCITFNLQFVSQRVPRKLRKDFSSVDFLKLSDAISSLNWNMLLGTPSVEIMWSEFTETVERLINQYSRRRSSLSCPGKPWITDCLLGMIQTKRNLWQRFKRSRSDLDFSRHRSFSNRLSLEIRKARVQYEDRIATGSSRKEFFRHVRSRLNTKVSVPLLHDPDGRVCSDNEQVAALFARSFSAVYSNEPPGECPEVLTPRNAASLQHVDFPPHEIEHLLRNIDGSTSPGLDGLAASVLKRCATALSAPLSLLYKASFTQGVLPQSWLDASVTPIFKKGDKLNPENYRPISLVPIVAKIAERVILNRLLPFMLDSGVIPGQQHGFIPGRSVLTNLLQCMDSWTKSLDKGIPVDVLYLDFSRAFDRVPKRRLLHKLEHFGIRGPLLTWIQSFLSNRTFSVRVADKHSPKSSVVSGVPQGSVLGPVLFLIYTADLAPLLKSGFAFYADDIKLYGNPLDGPNLLHDDLRTISRWSSDWLLPLNPAKCSVLHLGLANPRSVYTLRDVVLSAENTHNDLGVLITSSLSWSEHILSISKRANKFLYLIKKAFSGCSFQTFITLFKTYVRPILEFAGPVWCPTLVRDAVILESVQRRATRLPFGANRPSYEERLVMSGLPKFLDRRLRGDLIVCYRALHGLFGVDLSHMFQLNVNQLRGHSLKLKKENFRSTVRQVFVSNRVFDTWNGLPEEVVRAPSVNVFKNRFDRLVLQT